MRVVLLAAAAATLTCAAHAQTPAEPPRPPREPPSNLETGVSVDRFVRSPSQAPARVVLDTMLSQTLFGPGDPQAPGDPGDVLLYRKEIAVNTLQPGETTSLGQSEDQMVFYVEQGEGRLDDGRSYWPLRPGTLVLAPPGVGHRFNATGDAPLTMVSVRIGVEEGVTPKTEMIVRDVTKMAYTERNVHWSHMAKYVLVGERDGLFSSDRVYLVYLPPMSAGGPHAHSPGQEEIWIKVSEGEALMQLGSEIRPWAMNTAMMAPPNGQTVHAAYNLDDHLQAWLYVARLNPNPNANARPSTRPPPPPAVAEGLAASNVRPTRLPAPGSRSADR